MTIISNNCLGAYTYKMLGLEYTSPFIWSQTFLSDILKIVQDLSQLDFQNIRLTDANNEYIPDHRSKGSYAVQLENGAKSYFIHYKDKQDTEDKWRRRSNRIDKNDIVIYLMSSRPKIDTESLLGAIRDECLVRGYKFIYVNTNPNIKSIGQDFSNFVDFNDSICPFKLAQMALPYFLSELSTKSIK